MDSIVPENLTQCTFNFETLNNQSAEDIPLHISQTIPLKQCKGPCQQFFPHTFEYFRVEEKGKRPGSWCRTCNKERLKAWREKNREHAISYDKRYKEQHKPTPKPPICNEDEKQCTKCLKILPATPAYFHKARRGAKGLAAVCKNCIGKGKNFGKSRITCNEDERQCPHCEKVFPKTSEYFGRAKSEKDGLSYWCRNCVRKRYQERKEEKNQKRRQDRKNNLEEYRNKDRARYYKNYEHIKERKRRHYAKHRDKRRKANNMYRIAHQAERNAYMRNRNARKRSIPGTHTIEQIREQLKRQRYRCYYAACGHAKFERRNGQYIYHVEHTFPVSRVVGTGIPANSMDYLVLACPTCNLSKGDKFPWEWAEGGRLV